MFDSEIRNTAPCIELVGANNGLGGTDIDTLSAAAAMLGGITVKRQG